MLCNCGGILVVKRIENYPLNIDSKEKIIYPRVCDVECLQCGKIHYSQPYDWGNRLNIVRVKDEDAD